MGCVIVFSKSRKSLLTGYVTSLLLPAHNLKGIARLNNALVYPRTFGKKLLVISMFLATTAAALYFLHHKSVDSLNACINLIWTHTSFARYCHIKEILCQCWNSSICHLTQGNVIILLFKVLES